MNQEIPLVSGTIPHPQEELPLINSSEIRTESPILAQTIVNMMPETSAVTGTLKRPRKTYALEVLQVEGGPFQKARTEAVISFDDSDSEGIKFPHNDPLVIMPMIDNSLVK